MAVNVQYDPTADAAFIEISKGVSANTIVVTDNINVDVDEAGRLLSIEVLAVSRIAPSLAVTSMSAIAAE
jgi:uncharacterized protein YuzE